MFELKTIRVKVFNYEAYVKKGQKYAFKDRSNTLHFTVLLVRM